MLCKKCGAQIGKADRRADGTYQCPGCKTVYRVKAKAEPGKAAAPGKKAAPEEKAAPAGRHVARGSAARRGRYALDWRRIAVVVGALVAVVAVVLVAKFALGGHKDVVANSAVATATAAVEATAAPTAAPTEAPKPTASVHFRAVGDVMAHKLQLTHALQADGSYDFSSQFEYVKEALSKADYTIANLELSIAVNGDYSSFPYFRTPEAILTALKDCGVDLLTMGNNHILDGFFEGLVNTVDKAEAHGFDHVGAYRTAEEAQQPLVVDINGIKFGFLAYTLDVNDNDKRIEPDQARFCVKRLADADFKADVQVLRDLGAEVVICLPHWGTEGKRSVAGSCRSYAQEMVNAGVDIILGSHPHVVLPIDHGELDVNGEKKDILIAWSMGNFISYMASQYMDSGIIVDFTVTRDESGKIRIHDVGYVPVYVCGNKNVFHLICSGDFYDQQPSGMSDEDYRRMKQSVREIAGMIGQDGITLLQN